MVLVEVVRSYLGRVPEFGWEETGRLWNTYRFSRWYDWDPKGVNVELNFQALHQTRRGLRMCMQHGSKYCRLKRTANTNGILYVSCHTAQSNSLKFKPTAPFSTNNKFVNFTNISILQHNLWFITSYYWMRWARHVARMGEGRGVRKVLVGKPEGKRQLGRPRRRWGIILRWVFRKWEGFVGTGWSWLRIGTVGGRLRVR